MNSLLLSSEKRLQEKEEEESTTKSGIGQVNAAYGSNAQEFLKNHSEVRTEMRIPLLIKDTDGS